MRDKANVELLLLNSLLKGNDETQKKIQTANLSPDIFKTYTAEYRWIQEFKSQYGKYPGRQAFAKKFKDFQWFKVTESADYYLDEIVQRENLLRLRTIANRVKPLVDAGRVSDAMLEMRAALESATVSIDSVTTNWKKPGNDRFNEAVVERAKRLASGKSYVTPYPKLNKYLISMNAGNLVTLTARLGVGKTWILLNFALHLMRAGARVLIISKEMPADECMDRLDVMDARLDWPRFLRGSLIPAQRARYKKMLKRRRKYKGELKIVGETQIEGNGLSAMIAEIDKFSPDAVFVDGVYQFDVQGVKDEVQKMMHVSRRMKRIAIVKKILVFQTVQQNRSAEGKKGGGGVGAISWSDSVGQDSDIALELISPEGRESNYRILKVIKGRNVGYTEVALNFVMQPKLDIGQMHGDLKLKEARRNKVTVSQVPEKKHD